MMIKRIKTCTIWLVLSSLLLSACGGAGTAVGGQSSTTPAGNAQRGTIAISGAFALYPLMTRWAEVYQKVQPGVKFDISAGGAGKGMTDTLAGVVDLGMVSRTIKPEEEAQGAYGVAVTKDAVFALINAKNPVVNEILAQGIAPETFVKIYITGEITTWGQVVDRPEITDKINVYTRSDAAGAPEMWAKFLDDHAQEDLLGIGMNADPGLLEAVYKDPLGIGYNNLGYAFDLATGGPVPNMIVVPIDMNGDGQADADERIDNLAEAIDAVATGKYPSPPARPLYVVTKGRPTGVTQAFIEWILTDGQAMVGEAGYVRLPDAQLAESLERVK